ncbi:MAG: metal-dependent hydrolase [Acidimicrobiales bacterium]
MSWAAHELESYVLQKHVKAKISYIAVLFGCLLPDFFTKLPVYGLHIGDVELIKAKTPYKYHRGWPGVGPTHSLLWAFLISTLVLVVWRNRAWFLGILIGTAAHVFTDTFDSVGTMVFFPFTTEHYSTGMWAYAAQQGRYGDAAAYYSSLGGVWDVFWLLIALTGAGVLGRKYFREQVMPNDPGAWAWLKRTFGLNDSAMLAAYRAWFVYGTARIFAWFAWARLLNPERGKEVLDLSWGGPSWVEKVSYPFPGWGTFLLHTTIGILGWTVTVVVGWRWFGRRLWVRAARKEAERDTAAMRELGLPEPATTS